MIWMMMRKRMMNCGLSCLQPITQFKIAFLFWPQGPRALAVKIIIIIFSGLYHIIIIINNIIMFFRFLKMARALLEFIFVTDNKGIESNPVMQEVYASAGQWALSSNLEEMGDLRRSIKACIGLQHASGYLGIGQLQCHLCLNTS